MHYNYFVMFKAAAQTAAAGQVAGYTPLHCTKPVLLTASQHTFYWLHYTTRGGSKGVKIPWDFIEPTDTGRMQFGEQCSGIKTWPRTRLHIQRCKYCPPYQGRYRERGISPLLSTRDPFWPVIIKAGYNPFLTAYCPSPRTPFSPSFLPKWKKKPKQKTMTKKKTFGRRWTKILYKENRCLPTGKATA